MKILNWKTVFISGLIHEGLCEKNDDERVQIARGDNGERGGGVAAGPMGPALDTFDFPDTPREIKGKWSMATRCGKEAGIGEEGKDQRFDKKCPNVILINTDDMAWGDLTVNNPSKLIPTPNIDRLVSKGINFRDGHACNARCAPSRYCLMTGRHHFRRGDYHYAPMNLEYGRKILPQLFRRNNYATMIVGKEQPTGRSFATTTKGGTDFFFLEGPRMWGFQQSFTSRSYCCTPGAGYFKNDRPVADFNKWAIFTDFRDASGGNGILADSQHIDDFLKKKSNWHLLDGYTVHGGPHHKEKNPRRRTTYTAYWDAVAKGPTRRRRRATLDGTRYRRSGLSTPAQPDQSFIRVQDQESGRIMLANYHLSGAKPTFERLSYEFGAGGLTFDTFNEAMLAKNAALKKIEHRLGKDSHIYKQMTKTDPARTQPDFDSKLIMKTFHQKAIDMINTHVEAKNPKFKKNTRKTIRPANQNQPFFMYLSFRAPHSPFSHNMTDEEAANFLPYSILGKPSEQIGLFDGYIGNVMKTLADQDIADNTMVIFTADNGPDATSFKDFYKYGHIRTATMRGKKASVYEGGHRVPMLLWWPMGVDKALHGSNFDLPVSQLDFFATYAEVLGYPLPGKDKCVYSYNSNNAHVHGRTASDVGRPYKGEGKDYKVWLRDSKRMTNEEMVEKYGGYDSDCGARTNGGKCDYQEEYATLGASRVEEWITKEDLTGYVVGWDGCMAEDSMSFASAFKATKVGERTTQDGKVFHKFDHTLGSSEKKGEAGKHRTMLASGKLGDMSIRFGRYKLIRFSGPKDYRTRNRQHMVSHESPEWHEAAAKDRCFYDLEGKLTTPDCTVDMKCRNYKSGDSKNGGQWCMRDHYYQLFDLEKNFGEKTLCVGNERTNDSNEALEEMMGLSIARGLVKTPGEKPTDPFGYTVGMETSPKGMWLNDCCVIGQQKKPEGSLMRKNPRNKPVDPCSTIQVKRDGKISSAGKCRYKSQYAAKAGSTYAEYMKFHEKEMNKALNKKNYDDLFGWDEKTQFPVVPEEDYRAGFVCTKIKFSLPDHAQSKKSENYIWDKELEKWVHATKLHQGCNPDDTYIPTQAPTTQGTTKAPTTQGTTKAPTTPAPTTQKTNPLTTKKPVTEAPTQKPTDPPVTKPPTTDAPDGPTCAIPDHSGPLAEGWEANDLYRESIDLSRRTNPDIANGELDPNEFGEWTKFATCLKNVMRLMEGQGYFKETHFTNGKNDHVRTDIRPTMESGEQVASGSDDILAGATIGSSNYVKSWAADLYQAVGSDGREFHGGGMRYNEHTDGSDSLVEKCAQHLPEHVKSNSSLQPMAITPNFDLDMDLVGWYDNTDANYGGDTELQYMGEGPDGAIYEDHRPVRKYYKTVEGFNNKYLNAFAPKYT